MTSREASTARDPSPIKPPVWTWEVPLYFFVGGVAGLSAVIALGAALAGADPSTVRAARSVAAIGALVSPLLLISDLGRPGRFLYMLRVFKPTSAMSVGAWTLVVFSGAAISALLLSTVDASGLASRLTLVALDTVAAVTGLVLATYTGVLLGATVIPGWAAHHRRLPFEFGISSLGAAASMIELVGGFTPPLHRIALAAAAIKTMLWIGETVGARGAASRQEHRLIRWASVLSGPAALLLRIVGSPLPAFRAPAALGAIAGSILLRYGWISAGRADRASMRK
ncbi:MAG TPA: NrfD/PsrC family molybdoenzyme membrane anchor subunit [Vicinamibacterales bacterium]|nr:NrfD/PsrC family molybdoenzyme membrane anchor subunit [Vicinamibacterales bacterium]